MKKEALLLLAVAVILATAGFARSAPTPTRHRRAEIATPTLSGAKFSAATVVASLPVPAATTDTSNAVGTTAPTPAPDGDPPRAASASPARPSVRDSQAAPRQAQSSHRSRTLADVPPQSNASGVAANRWIGFYVPGVPDDMSALDTLQSQVGGKAAVVNFFIADTEAFPAARCENIVDAGSIPLVTLEFWSTQSGGLSAITNGSKDAYLEEFAEDARAFGKTLWLRPFHEMNGNWYPWSASGDNTPAQLIAAWRHVHDIFADEGATNVKFVWCPNIDYKVSSYYPGNAYVDYAAIDGYNFGTPWRSFSSVFGPTYAAVTALTDKPLFIAETACSSTGGDKAAWIADMFKQIDAKYTRITGVCWFDANKERDWRVDSSASSLQAFRAGVTDGF